MVRIILGKDRKPGCPRSAVSAFDAVLLGGAAISAVAAVFMFEWHF